MWQKCQSSWASFFCSSLAKSKPAWLCPKEFKFKAKNYFLYTTTDRTTFQHCSCLVYISSSRFHCEYVQIFCFQAKCFIVLDPFSSYCNFPQRINIVSEKENHLHGIKGIEPWSTACWSVVLPSKLCNWHHMLETLVTNCVNYTM